jgi:hypothetical protein
MRFWLLILLVLCASGSPAAAAKRVLGPLGFAAEPPRFRLGDDPQWSRPEFDDSSWETGTGPPRLPARAGPFWLRVRLELLPLPDGKPRDGVVISVVAAYDFYWDGHLIARSGVVGHDRASEAAGVLDNVIQIPEALRGPGEHVMALRMSSHRAGFPSDSFQLQLRFDDYRQILTGRGQRPVLSVLAAGGAFVCGVVFALMWIFNDRRWATLLFSLLCLVAAAMQALQAWRWLLDYPYDWHYPRLLVISWLVIALGLLLVAYVQAFFGVPWSRIRLVVSVVLMAIGWQFSFLYHIKSLIVASIALAITAGAAIWAVCRGRRSAWLVVAGLAISGVVLFSNPQNMLEHAFFLSFGAPLLGGATAHILQWREERRQAHEARLTSARLEVELLKKNIQPHFLMNSLASLMEVIEQSPAGAGPLIEALAGEFRILARVSGEKLITLGQELELCDCHLRVMSMRQGTSWSLERNGLNLDLPVPPALFHTLIENGITHSEGRPRSRVFHLRGETANGAARFVLIAPVAEASAKLPPEIATGEQPGAKNGEGTGLRYVRARLEESFPGRWTLRSGLTPAGWQTEIEFRHSA